jgi:U32 family peptidase
MNIQETKPPYMELLAPAGSFAAFEAALEEGADAVYVGVPGFNARALARDFSYAEIQAMIHRAHRNKARLYLAMNSLVKESELAGAVEGLANLEAMQPDAVIVQDMGLVRLVRRYFPGLRLHASTLMSAHNSLAVADLVRTGLQRVVLARELTIDEIGSIFRKTGAELEVFVHGAMCFSLSGLCLFSSLHGGKSSLRGQCVQPCRRRYAWRKSRPRLGQSGASGKGGGYLFSMNDLCGIDLLPKLKQAGVASLKIEGRMKSAEYVRKTVRAYRLLLDSHGGGGNPARDLLHEVRQLLDEAMGRKRSTGFFLDLKPEEAVSPHFSGNIGIMAGQVWKLDIVSPGSSRPRSILSVRLREEIRLGDRLRLHDEQSGERIAFTLRSLKAGNRTVQRGLAGQHVTIIVGQALFRGTRKTFRGNLFKVDVGSHRAEEQQAAKRLSRSKGRAPQLDSRRMERILRDIEGSAQETRGKAVLRRSGGKGCRWWVRIRSFQDTRERLPVTPDRYILALTRENIAQSGAVSEKSRQGRIPLVWSLPPFITEEEIPWYSSSIASLINEGFSDFQLGHWTQRTFFENAITPPGRVKLYGDYTFNILNSMALQAMHELGFTALQFSIETDRENLALAAGRFKSRPGRIQGNGEDCMVGVYVYGKPALFTARLDDRRYEYGRPFVSPKGESFILERKQGMTTARSTAPFSLLEWRNELPAMGLDYLVVDVSEGNMKRNAADFISLCTRRGKNIPVMTGNFPGVLL